MHKLGFVNAIFPKDHFMDHVLKVIQPMAQYSLHATSVTKALVQQTSVDLLKKVNEREMVALFKALTSEEHANAVRRFSGSFSTV